MNTVTVEQIVIFHRKIVNVTGGSDGIRDRTLIDSALNKAILTFDGKELYEGLIRKIAVISYALIKNHGFVDGNKRIGVATMLLLLTLNDITINYSQSELIDLGLRVAEGLLKEEDIEHWILKHQV
ncbi:type II toxin-antitoxin system death-on-curing family toxin [Paenibacillus sp. WQ 127069]|uniref:Type II toxin-antitoxin system death-on-curing family toxin n=1 Tax=Paenibacillus baimaensis TaxID=2982185 RepID=A0ABT2UBJ1_9BACL|nr:type II toxin-antitoxin system death-on-curing family toxin [Paenibacillus sp. WQ 127069]MCU6791962.1 type II toxin-antitoxin system death-on-curing family toxin [Paenibacillus sp. WQ 127069]